MVKIGLLIVVIAMVVKAWWLGSAYWVEHVDVKWMTVPRPRIEILGVVVGAILITYITYAIDRDRPRR